MGTRTARYGAGDPEDPCTWCGGVEWVPLNRAERREARRATEHDATPFVARCAACGALRAQGLVPNVIGDALRRALGGQGPKGA